MEISRRTWLVPALFVSVALPFAAAATTWYVAPGGSDARDGRTAATAFGTLQMAAGVVEPGDTVLLAGGTYEAPPAASDRQPHSALLNITRSGRPGAWITWQALPGQRPVLRSRRWSTIEVDASYQVIDGLAIVGMNDSLVLADALAAAKGPVRQPLYNTNGITVNGRGLAPDAKPHHVTVRNCTVARMPGAALPQSKRIT